MTESSSPKQPPVHGGPSLVLGPMLRFVDQTRAAVWLETDQSAKVEILGHSTSTFSIGGHHYCIVDISGLSPNSITPYEVMLNGAQAWPLPEWDEWPPSVIRTQSASARASIVFGSCRTGFPHTRPYCLSPYQH